MRVRYGTGKWQATLRMFAGIALVGAFVGASPAAFAVANEDVPAEDADEEVVSARESAFSLGHVAIECIDEEAEAADDTMDDASDAVARGRALAIGVPSLRAYRITNQGEASYIRVSSRTLFGTLEHANDSAMVETDDPADEATGDRPAEVAFWRLAEDGFWYRSQPLGVDESITVQVAVEIPDEEEWLMALSTGKASEVIETMDIQALQARNKTIDLGSTDPWGMRDPSMPDGEGPMSNEPEGGAL